MKIKRELSSGLLLILPAISLFLILTYACTPVNFLNPTPTQNISHPPTTGVSLPDLVVSKVYIPSNSADLCNSQEAKPSVTVEIRNQGRGDAGAFSITINQTIHEIESGLAAGATIDMPNIQDLQLYITVDSTSNITESDEGNNIWTGTLTQPTLPSECLPTLTPAVVYQQPNFQLTGHRAKIWSVDFSKSGNMLVSGSVDDTMRLWRVQDAQLLRTMSSHPFPVLTVKFTPNQALLASGSTDGLIRLWRVSDSNLERTLQGHADWVVSIDISSNGQFLVSGGKDFTVRVWRISDGQLVQTVDEGMSAINAVAFSPDNQSIAWSEDTGTVRLRTLNGDWIHTFKPGNLPSLSIGFSPDNRLLAAGFWDGTLRIWRIEDGTLLQTLSGHNAAVSSLSFSPDGRWLVSGSWDKTLRLWDLDAASSKFIPSRILVGHTAPVNSVDISPKGDLIASAGDDNLILLWIMPKEQ